jgi:hypothetical protein
MMNIASTLLIFYLLIALSCSNKINEGNTFSDDDNSESVEGGIVVYESNGHGLIVATADLGKHDWEAAIAACDELELNGFNDWRLPTKEELDTLYTVLKLQGKGAFEDGSYWSSSEYNSYYAWRKNFKTGKVDRRGNKTKEQGVRAVRDY